MGFVILVVEIFIERLDFRKKILRLRKVLR